MELFEDIETDNTTCTMCQAYKWGPLLSVLRSCPSDHKEEIESWPSQAVIKSAASAASPKTKIQESMGA